MGHVCRGPHVRRDRPERRLRAGARNGAAGTGPDVAVRGPFCQAARMGFRRWVGQSAQWPPVSFS